MTAHDPGFKWFRDYYNQCLTEAEARKLVRLGTPVALDPPASRYFLVESLDDDGFTAGEVNGTERIRAKYTDVVFPGNILYVLEFDKETQAAAEAAVLIRRMQNEG